MSNQMVKGNTAVIVGAMYAGCDCFFGYPITPASEILHEASKYFPMVGRNFVQAESEEASINMVYEIIHTAFCRPWHTFDTGTWQDPACHRQSQSSIR